MVKVTTAESPIRTDSFASQPGDIMKVHWYKKSRRPVGGISRFGSPSRARMTSAKFFVALACLLVLAVSAEEQQDTKQNVKRGLTDFGFSGFESDHGPHVITNTIPVPQPYPVHVERKVPYPVKVPVDRPYPVHIPKPYPVHIEKPVPYKVDRPVPYPVRVPYKVPVIHRVEVPVPKPYPVPVERPYPVPVPQPYVVVKKVPVYINAGSSYGSYDSGHGSFGHSGFSSDSFGHDHGSSSHQITVHH